MTTINLTTTIKAPIQTVFDVSRNIDIHQQSASKTNEVAIAGITSGLINLNETVTWRGKHFGFYLTHKSRITAMVLNDYFVDEMEEGKFKTFKHKLHIEPQSKRLAQALPLCFFVPFVVKNSSFVFPNFFA